MNRHAWINNMFSFTARPLRPGIDEIERQYDVTITLKAGIDYSYTGYFSKEQAGGRNADFSL